MAAPAEMTTRDISGKYIMVCLTPLQSFQLPMTLVQNKTLSDDNDEILRLQGVGWMTRKAISIATLYLDVRHFTEDGIEQIVIDQTITGGIKGTKEHRRFDWVERPHEDHIFGPVLGKSNRLTLDEIEQDWLKQDWLEESFLDGKIIYTRATSDTEKSGRTWTAQQVGLLSITSIPPLTTATLTGIPGLWL